VKRRWCNMKEEISATKGGEIIGKIL